MQFGDTGILGVFLVRLEWQTDERGGFLRLFDADAFAAKGLPRSFAQTSLSETRQAGSIRGLHLQRPPHGETKLVRCVRGAMFDVVVDLRAGSPTWLHWRAFTLRAGDSQLVVVPEGCAHGFQTLVDHTEVLYQISSPYAPEHAVGLRYNDQALGLPWPIPATMVSERDRTWPLLPTGADTAADTPRGRPN